MKNNLKLTLSFFILSFVTLIGSVFAWVSLSKRSNLGDMGGNIGDYTDLVVFEVKRLGDVDYTLISTIEEMHSVFGETRPGEEYTFKITVENKTTQNFDFFATITGISNELSYGGNSNFDIRDVFYIKNGDVFINGVSQKLTPIDPDDEIELYDQILNIYRLSNLMVNSSIPLISPVTIGVGLEIELIFTLVYDPNTVNIGYQNNQLVFEGIYLYGQ